MSGSIDRTTLSPTPSSQQWRKKFPPDGGNFV